MNNKFSARDFFLHLGVFVTFYAGIIALTTLLFEVINHAYPKITNAYYYYFPSISLEVATLIVVAPLFFFLSSALQKTYSVDPDLREALIRRWLSYITIFVAGVVIAGDLVTVIYTFIDGQEMTTAFLLKVFVLFVISTGVFVYYLREIKNSILSSERRIWRICVAILVIGSIVLGFLVIGTPKEQREYRFDMQKTNDLQSIQWQIINYWQMKGALPDALSDLEDSLKSGITPIDPQNGVAYGYEKTNTLSFKLCANFNREARVGVPVEGSMTRPAYEGMYPGGENWEHGAGSFCFDRAIDPDLYPKIIR